MKRIIIRMPNWLGDLIMATPLIEDVKKLFPEAHLSALCETHLSSLLRENPYLDEVIGFSRSRRFFPKNAGGNPLISQLMREKYDIGILTTNSFSSALIFWQAGVKERIGFRKHSRDLFVNQSVAYSENLENQHLVVTYKELLQPLGLDVSDTKPTLYINEEEREHAKKRIGEGKLVLGINATAAYGPAKCWIPERFKKVAKRFLDLDPDVQVLFFGDSKSKTYIEGLCEGLSERAVNLAGETSLRELTALIESCHVFLTNDSGPMHMAAALGTPLVALFGSTCDVATGPYGMGRVIHKRASCSPCFRRVCPIDFRCMRAIETDEVVNELAKALDDRPIEDKSILGIVRGIQEKLGVTISA